MIGTIRKHSTWLWSIIIVVTVFAFVIWGTNPGQQGGGPRAALGLIDGQPVTEEAFLAAQRVVLMRFFLRTGQMPDAEAERMGFNLQRETYSTLLLQQKLQDMNIHTGAEAKGVLAANILRSVQSQGINSLARLEEALLQPQGLSLADLDRFIEHELGVQQLLTLEGATGQFITPQQIESLWRRENQEISAQAVFFSASNHLQSVEVTPDALGTFFTNQMARYRIPDRIQVAYVAYPVSNYLDKATERMATVTNLTEQLGRIYDERGSNFYAGLTRDAALEEIRQDEHP